MDFPNRYDRNHEALSADEQQKLAAAHVGVFGCGGLGGLVIEALARIGVGHLRVVDGDVFEQSNLNRQLLSSEAALGREKALVAAERIQAINSEVEAEPIVAFLDEAIAASMLAGLDCAVDCLDNPDARFWLAHACQQQGVPLAYGAIAGWFGQACTVYPGDPSFATVYGAVAGKDIKNPLGNLPFTAYVTSSVQAAETVKVLLDRPGQLRNRLLMIDLLGGAIDEIELR